MVVPRASSMAAIAPSPKTTEDCTCGLSRECAVVLRTTKGCGLGISVYPDFVYNAEGGGGSGKAVKLSDGCWRVQFDATEINIPDVSFRTTKLLSVPIPPPIRIKIVPDTLEGTVDLETGKIVLRFQSKFYFSATDLYRPPPLVVDTVLTTEDTHGEQRGGTGSRLDAHGNCRLVGVARLVPIGDLFMDKFLMLPADCYASMNANFTFNIAS